MEHSLLHSTVYFLIAAVIAVPLFYRLRLGAILGYLTAGAVLGPQGLHLISEPSHVLHFAEFGVVLLLFVIGLELNPEKLWQMRYQITALGLSQLLLCTAAIAAMAGFIMDLAPSTAILLGLTLGLSSTAFAVQLMREQGLMGLSLGRKGFSILLLQDLAVIPILLYVSWLAPVEDAGQVSPHWWQGLLAVMAVLIIGRFAINPILRLVSRSASRELLTAAALLIVTGTALLMQSTGLTMGMGAFIAGIILGNSSFRHQLEADLEPFKGLLLGLFFIAVGMSLDLRLFVQQPFFILGCALLLVAVKTGIIAALVRLTHCNWKESVLLGLILSQGGEFAFVIMNKALDLNIVPLAVRDQVVLIVGVSMALTAPLVLAFKRFSQHRGPEGANDRPYDNLSNDDPEVIIAGFGRFGQIVGRILAANKMKFTALDKDAEHVEFVKQFGNKIFFGDATRIDLLEAAGAENARIIVIAVDEIEDSLAIAHNVRLHFPKLQIVVRAHNRAHAYQLYQMGIKLVIRELLESSLVAASHTLSNLGFTDSQVSQMVDTFRKHDEKMVLQASAHQDNTEQLIEIAEEGRKELEILFAQDNRP